MSILNAIREKSIEARKLGDRLASSLLVTLLSEVSMVGKNAGRETTDAEAVAVVKKFINNNRETLGIVLHLDQTRADLIANEIAILEQFLPKQLTADELEVEARKIVIELNVSTPRDMGTVMKVLKERFDGTYDAKSASDIVKKLLA